MGIKEEPAKEAEESQQGGRRAGRGGVWESKRKCRKKGCSGVPSTANRSSVVRTERSSLNLAMT